MKEQAVLLHEKLLRIAGDQYWENTRRQFKKPKNTEWICTESNRHKDKTGDLKASPQPLHQRRSSVDIGQVEHYLHLQQNIK